MKKTILAIIFIASTIISCTKKPVNPTQTPLSTDYEFYFNGNKIQYEEEILTKDFVLATDQLNNQLAYYYFDSYEKAKSFINAHIELTQLQSTIRNNEKLRRYAESINEDQYLAEHGENSELLQNFINQNKTRVFPFELYTNINFGGALFLVPGPRANLGWMNNNAESAKQIVNNGPIAQMLFDLPNFNPGAGTFFMMVNNYPSLWFVGWGNRASSAG